MKDHLAELAERRAHLQRRTAAQRLQLGRHVDAIETRVGGAERGLLNLTGWLRRPVLLAGGAALLMLVGPRRVLGFAGRAVLLFSTARRLLRLFGQR